MRFVPAWFSRRFASACGRWLVSATSRSCACGSTAIGTAPSEATKPCNVRYRSGSVVVSGVRNHVAPRKRPAVACAGPCVSEPQTGCPPMKRPSLTARVTGVFVEPTSVTVVPSPVASSTAATCPGKAATGAATITSSAPDTASSSDSAASRAPRSAATPSASASMSQPRTLPTPASRAPSPTDAPISPVPTIASRSTFTSTDRAAHQLGQRADLVCEVRKVGDGNLLRAVAERILGSRVHLDDDPVRTRGHRGTRKRQDELTPARGMRWIDDHRQMRLLLQHGNGADVERVPRRALKRRNPPLAEDYLGVPFLDDVLGRHQQLLDRRRRAALQQDRLVRPAH